MAKMGFGIYISSPILLPPRFEGSPSANSRSFTPPPLRLPSFSCPSFPFESTMSTSSCATPSVNVHLPGANAAINDIPVGSSTSPSLLTLDDERLTVRPRFTALHPFAYPYPLESEPLVILMMADRSPCVLPCCYRLCRRSVYPPLALVRNRE